MTPQQKTFRCKIDSSPFPRQVKLAFAGNHPVTFLVFLARNPKSIGIPFPKTKPKLSRLVKNLAEKFDEGCNLSGVCEHRASYCELGFFVAMSAVNITNVAVLDNPTLFLAPFQFEISYECLTPLEDGTFFLIPLIFLFSLSILISFL